MKFPRLDIENFMTISEAKISLADRGLLAIQGKNDGDSSASSNGAGKSTVPDALCWCLYGTTARGLEGDRVVNNVAGKGCRVQVLVDDDGAIYAVTRHRKHPTGKNGVTLEQVHPVALDMTQGTDKLTQEKINTILGCSYEVFRAAVYAGQEAMPDLPGMTDKQLKVLVEEAAGITTLERAYELARSGLTIAKNDQTTKLMKAEAARKDVVTAEAHIVGLRHFGDDWRDSQLARGVAVMNEINQAVEEFDKLATNRASYDSALWTAQRDTLHAALKAVEPQRVEERRLLKELGALEGIHTRLRASAGIKKAAAERGKHALDHINDRVDADCGECGKAYQLEDMAAATAAQRAVLIAQITELRAAKSELDDAAKRVSDAQSALEAHRASMTDVTETHDKLTSVNEWFTKVDALDHQIVTLKKSIEDIRCRHRKLCEEKNPFPDRIVAAITARDKLDLEAKELEDAAIKATRAFELAEVAAKVFSPAGVRAQILDTVTPHLNDRTSHYLGTLSDGHITANWQTLSRTAKGELREKFTIDVTHDQGGDVFAAMSGGEKRKVRLSCALALQDLVASRAIKPIDLWIGDEIDDALDPAGLERLMTVLKEKSRERGSVIIISHNSLSDWITEVVTVEKRGRGLSTLVE